MALNYFDTSGLAKRYLSERGSLWVRDLVSQETVVISDLADAELASLLARRVRESTLRPVDAAELFATFLQDRNDYETIELTSGIAQAAAELLLVAPPTIALRTLDALHVVSAQRAFDAARRRGIPTGRFITADRGLLAAAAWVGFSVLNPEDYP